MPSSFSRSCIHTVVLEQCPNCSVCLCLPSRIPTCTLHIAARQVFRKCHVSGISLPCSRSSGGLFLQLELNPNSLSWPTRQDVFNLVSFNSSLCSNHTGLFSFKYAKLVSILSFGNYCAFCLECSSLSSLHGCLLLDIQISTEMSLLTDVFPPVLAEEMPPTLFFISHCPILFSLYLLSLSVIVFFFIFPHHKCFTYYVFNFYKIVLFFFS